MTNYENMEQSEARDDRGERAGQFVVRATQEEMERWGMDYMMEDDANVDPSTDLKRKIDGQRVVVYEKKREI